MARSRNYDYAVPDYDQTVERADRKGSMFDNMLKDVKIYKSKQGANLLRILPRPKADNPLNLYGLPVYIHRGVGPNDRQYLCLRENPASPHKHCPICQELYDLGSKATQEDKAQLRAKVSVLFYVIDRDAEKEGVQVWMASPTIDSEIAAQCVNRRTKSWINIVDPDEGYDIEFTRTGTGLRNTRYRGFQVMRDPSPLAESQNKIDEWMDVAFDKPLTSILQFYSPEHIEEVFYGRAKEDVGDEQSKPRARDVDAAGEPEESSVYRDPSILPSRRRVVHEDKEDASELLATEALSAIHEAVTSERRPRSQLSRELDDEIPERAGGSPERTGRSHGSGEPGEPARGSTRMRSVPPPDEDAEADAELAERQARRQRMRERLNRE